MSELPEWANWVARDEGGTLWMYNDKPKKNPNGGFWRVRSTGGKAEWVEVDTYAHVKWTDKHPTRVTRETGFPRLDNELTESAWPTAEEATRNLHSNLTDIDLEKTKVESVSNIEPQHYRTGDKDLFDEWFGRYYHSEEIYTGREVFIAIMKSVAERYFRRYPNKNPEDLSKAIYTLERLKEYEEGEE